MKHYTALLAAAFEAQLPVTFRTDITTHDRARCAGNPDSRPFIWALGATGTNMVWLDPVDRRLTIRGAARDLIQCYLENDRANLFYWNGTSLAPINAETAICLIVGDT